MPVAVMPDTDLFEIEQTRHDIELRDVQDGSLVVSYNAVVENSTFTSARHVSSRLPIECLTLFESGTVDVEALTPEERAWIEAESVPNTIDFEGARV